MSSYKTNRLTDVLLASMAGLVIFTIIFCVRVAHGQTYLKTVKSKAAFYCGGPGEKKCNKNAHCPKGQEAILVRGGWFGDHYKKFRVSRLECAWVGPTGYREYGD